VPFALQALARIETSTPWTFDIVGAGVMTPSWQRMAKRLGIADRVVFHGFVTRDRLFDLLDRCDVYVFPSLLEGWPASIVEALSLGLPVITTKHQGMQDMVTDDCGRLVSATSSARRVSGFWSACAELARSPELVERLSRGALRRAEVFGPDAQVPLILETYEAALAAAGTRAGASA